MATTAIPEEPQAGLAKQDIAAQHAKNLSKAPRTIKDLLLGPEIVQAVHAVLASKAKAERFVRVAITATMRTPALLDCTKESFFKCLLDLSSYGLEPDGRHAHLIPFANNKVCGSCGHEHRGQVCARCKCASFRPSFECTLLIDYKGIVHCVRRSGEVSYIHADFVIPEDEFDYAYGSGAFLRHKPNADARSRFAALGLADKKETIRCFYSFVRMKDGSEDFMVLSLGEVEKVRRRSRAANAGPWTHEDDYLEMGKKTGFRKHSKWLPFSSETREIIERDDPDALEIAPALPETASLSLDAFRASSDENRGHDASAPTQEPSASATAPPPPSGDPTGTGKCAGERTVS